MPTAYTLATTKPAPRYAAMTKCVTSHGNAGVNIALATSTFFGSPLDESVNPWGVFSHEFTARMLMAPSTDTNGMGSPVHRCARGLSRSQP